MKSLSPRLSIALFASAWVSALVLSATISAPAHAGDNSDCEDGTCSTGNPPTEGLTRGLPAPDGESDTESEGAGFDDDVGEAAEPDSGSEAGGT